jgi:hypothetical protein
MTLRCCHTGRRCSVVFSDPKHLEARLFEFGNPAIVDLVQRYWIEEMQLFAPAPHGDDQICCLQLVRVDHDGVGLAAAGCGITPAPNRPRTEFLCAADPQMSRRGLELSWSPGRRTGRRPYVIPMPCFYEKIAVIRISTIDRPLSWQGEGSP